MLNLFATQKKNKFNRKTIVCIGGGTGLYSLLSGLKKQVPDRSVLKAVVSTLDNGGSSGELITQFGVLPPGDIRNCIVALSDEEEVLNELFQYRFDDNLKKHNFGNLLITALSDVTGSFEKAVKVASKILRIKGEVIPVCLEKSDLKAKFSDGSEVIGESEITGAGKKISNLSLNNGAVANIRAVEVLKSADIIIFGPGSLYTSIIPNLLFSDVKSAIMANQNAKKVLITGVMSQPGETDDFVVSDFKSELEKYLGGNLTHIIANSHIPVSLALKKYQQENKHPIPLDENNLSNVKLIKGNFIDENLIVRHDPQKLAKAIHDML